MKERFQVIGTNGKCTVPWLMLTPHEGQAWTNHGQSLETLNRRGGLCWIELLAVLEDKRQWDYKGIDEVAARKRVEAIIVKQACTVQMLKDDDGNYVPRDCCTMTNPATSGGVSEVDDVDLPCGVGCGMNCEECIVQKIMNEYAEITGQIN